MYDSRSDHPRGPQTRYGKSKRGSSHPDRNHMRYYYGRAVFPRPAMTAQAEIADDAYNGTKGYDDLIPGLKRIGPKAVEAWRRERRYWGLPQWERELLMAAEAGEGVEILDDNEAASWEMLESDEVEALGLPEGTRWSTDTSDKHYGRAAYLDVLDARLDYKLGGWNDPSEPDYWGGEDDDEPADDEDSWLPLMSYGEACEAMGGDGFTIEGPTMTPETGVSDAYVRVWKLAQDCDITAKNMVAYLRKIGEYVASHTSYVAVPIADLVRGQASDLQAAYGTRPLTSDDALRRLRVLMDAEALAKTPRPRPMPRPVPIPRPGAPRSSFDRNPFTYA